MKFKPSIISMMVVLSIAVLFSCGSNPNGPELPDEVLNAPHIVYIDGNRYELETALWRDFMPICPPDGQPLGVFICAKEIHSRPIPDYLRCDYIWVINDNEVWQTIPTEYERLEDLTKIQAYAGGGPKWKTGIKVDVVIRLKDSNLNYYLLKASDQPIGRTD